MKCGYQSLTFDNFLDLSLSIPSGSRSIALQDCLEDYVGAERMEKCGFKCAKCGAIDKMEKDLTIFRFPQILVINIKRFTGSRN
jgi:ubiquitin C-terminal hydrolase